MAFSEQPDVSISLKTVPYTLSFEYRERNYTEEGRFIVNNMGIIVDIKTSNANNERNIMPYTYISETTLPKVEQQVVDWIGKLEIMDGDGLMRLLYITSILLTSKNSLLLFDEIETGFHYSMYDSLWRLIARYSKRNNN